MLNEERVKHMVKLASYEHQGAEELKISTYETKDYIRIQVFITSLWVSASYFLLILLLGMAYAEKILEEMTVTKLAILIGSVLVVYVVILVQYIIFSRRFYQKKYLMAKRNVKRFAKNLEKLEKMYEKESV